MKVHVKVIKVTTKPGGGHKTVAVGSFDVEASTDDALRAKAREKLKAREIHSINRGPRGIVVYIHPRRLK